MKKNSIMIVDDSRVVHSQIKKCLEGEDSFEVIDCVQNGDDAIAHYQELHPDIVTMDIVMPGIDGFATAAQILERDPNARILMVSSLVYDDTIDEAVKIGAKGFVFKPLDKSQLLNALQDALTK